MQSAFWLKGLGLMMAFSFFLASASALSLTDFEKYLDLNFFSAADINAGFIGVMRFDASDAEVFGTNKNCLAVAWQNQIIPRKIKAFPSEETEIFFPLQADLNAFQESHDYILLAGCRAQDLNALEFAYDLNAWDFKASSFGPQWLSFTEIYVHPKISRQFVSANAFNRFESNALVSLASASCPRNYDCSAWAQAKAVKRQALDFSQPFYLELRGRIKFGRGKKIQAALSPEPRSFIGLTSALEKNFSLVLFGSNGRLTSTGKAIIDFNVFIRSLDENFFEFKVQERWQNPFSSGRKESAWIKSQLPQKKLYLALQSYADAPEEAGSSVRIIVKKIFFSPELKALYSFSGGQAGHGFNYVLPRITNFQPQGLTAKKRLAFDLMDSNANLDLLAVVFDANKSLHFNPFKDCHQADAFTFSCSYFEVMPEGEHEMQVSYGRNEGFNSVITAKHSFTLDLPPVITPPSKPYLNKPLVSFTVRDDWPGLDLNSLEIFDGNQTSPESASCQPMEKALENSLECQAALEEKEGWHEIQVKASSWLGQPSQTSFQVFLDKKPPSLEIVFPDENAVIDSTLITPDFKAVDETGISAVSFQLDGGGWQPFSESLSLDNGSHVLGLKAEDLAGNTTIESVSFTVAVAEKALSAPLPPGGGFGGGFGGGGGFNGFKKQSFVEEKVSLERSTESSTETESLSEINSVLNAQAEKPVDESQRIESRQDKDWKKTLDSTSEADLIEVKIPWPKKTSLTGLASLSAINFNALNEFLPLIAFFLALMFALHFLWKGFPKKSRPRPKKVPRLLD